MDFMRFANWRTFETGDHRVGASFTPSSPHYEGLETVLQDAHLRRDVARRPDLTPFVRDEGRDKAA